MAWDCTHDGTFPGIKERNNNTRAVSIGQPNVTQSVKSYKSGKLDGLMNKAP